MTLPRACVALRLDEAASGRLMAGCELVSASPADRATLLTAVADAEGLLCSNLMPVGAEIFDAAPRLRVVSGFGVGYDHFDVEEATRRGVAVCNTPGVLNAAVADLTLGLILALSRKLVANDTYVRSGAWTSRDPGPGLGWDLAGKTLGLIGYGRIGHAVAKRARAFDMRVVYHDVAALAPESSDQPRTLDELLAEADIVSVHVNLTPESTHPIGAREFALMKPTAVIVNTARGPVISEAALAAALQAGRIAGAALDVLEVEPAPAGAPILAAPNTVILPHVGSATVETRQAMLDLCLDNLLAVLRCETPPACVNPEALTRALRR